MPNIKSADKLLKILQDKTIEMCYLFIDYVIINNIVNITNIEVKFIYELSWEMLHIQGLGLGQIQVKDANKKAIFTNEGKEKWFECLLYNYINFTIKQQNKFKKKEKEIIGILENSKPKEKEQD
jgi:hypothetical protein